MARITRTTAQLGIKDASKAASKKSPEVGKAASPVVKRPTKKAAAKKVDREAEAAKAEAARAAEAAEAQRALEAEMAAREAEREKRWAENEEMRRTIEAEIIAQERRSRERQARKRAVETAERRRQARLRDAAFAGDMAAVREVVEAWVEELHGCTLIGAKVDCDDAHRHTALSEAACGGQPEVRAVFPALLGASAPPCRCLYPSSQPEVRRVRAPAPCAKAGPLAACRCHGRGRALLHLPCLPDQNAPF